MEPQVAQPTKILARGNNCDQATLLAFLHLSGLWDVLSISDRQIWIEKAEIQDTSGGRLLFRKLQQFGVF